MGLSLRNVTRKIGDVISPIVQGAETPINALRLGAANVTGNQAAANNARQQLVQGGHALAGIGQGIARTIPETAETIAHPFSQASYTPDTPFTKALFGSTPVQNIQRKVARTYDAHSNLPIWERVGLAGAEGVASVAQDLPTVTGVSKIAKARGIDSLGLATKKVSPMFSDSDMAELRLSRMHQAAQRPTAPVSSELENLQNRYEQPPQATVMDQVMSNSTGKSVPQVTNERDIDGIRIDAERQALNHLADGGSREEAANLYQKATGTTAKNAVYQVQRVAKSAKQSLNVSPKTPNPLLNRFKLPQPKPGEFDRIPSNQRAVVNSVDYAEQKALSHEKTLSDSDRANFADYFQGVKDVSKADNPAAVKAAITDARNLFDAGHALGENFGHTPHIKDFWPGYWDLNDPKVMEINQLKAEQAAESDLGTQHWNTLTPEEKATAAADYLPNSPYSKGIIGEDNNFAGFHNKSKIFATKAEGIAAGVKPLNDNPFDDIRRYAAGAKLQLGNQAVIQGVRHAEPATMGQRFGITLPGGGAVTTSKEGFKSIKPLGVRPPRNVVQKALQGTSKSIVRTIVANPLFHGANQEFNTIFQTAWRLPGNKIENIAKIVKNQASFDSKELDAVKTKYYAKGGFTPTYGKNDYGFIAKGLEKAGIDPAKAEFSPRAMAAIEERIRLSIFKQALDRKMNPELAIKEINRTLGGPELIGDFASSFGLFQHYLQTNIKLLGNIGTEAVKGNLAPLAGMATGYAAWMAANKGWQEATGNKNAQVRAPGALGTANQFVKGVVQAKRGQIPSIVISHTNPLVTAGIEEATNRDLRKPVIGPQAANNNLNGNRVNKAAADVVGPALTVQNVAGQKTSPAEAVLGYATGLYTPHAKGYQAAPNIPILNSKNAKSGNGLAAQSTYFNALDKMQNSVAGNPRASDAVNTYLNRNKTQDGNTIQLDPKDSLLNARTLVTNDKARLAIQDFEKSQANHDPMWDLSPSQLKTFLNYKAQIKDSADQLNIRDQNPWIYDLEAKQQGFYNSLQKSGNSEPSDFSKQHPFPLSTTEFNTMVQAAKINDPQAKAAFYDQHPELTQIDQKYGDYVNAVRANQDAVPLPAPPKPNDSTQAFLNEYIPADKATRKAIRTANPNGYAGMQAYLTQSSLYNLVRAAAVDELSGNAAGDQKLLKAAYSLGQFDIAKNPDGTYSIGTGSSGSSSGGSGSRSGRSSYTKAKLQAGDFFVDDAAGGKPRVARLKTGKAKKNPIRLAQLPYKSSIAVKGKPQVTIRKSKV